MINGHNPNAKKRQVIDCGAAVRLDDAVVEHGVVFIHPELPPMKLFFKLDPENKTLPQYHMEPVVPEHGALTQFAIMVHETADMIEMPPAPKIIKPGDLN